MKIHSTRFVGAELDTRHEGEIFGHLDRLKIMDLEACGVFPIGSYWLKEEWHHHLYGQPRWQLLGLIDTETTEILGSAVYEDRINVLYLHKMTVREQGHLAVFREMLTYIQGTLLGSRDRVVAFPNQRDTYWLNEFENQGYLNTGSFPFQGETINAVEWCKR